MARGPVHSVSPSSDSLMGTTRQRSFTLYCVALFVVAVTVAVVLWFFGGAPPMDRVLVLGCLFVFADHLDVDIGDDVGLSASLMIVIAAIVLFQDSAPALGPLLVGMFSGVYLDHVRSRDWRKI